MVRSTLLALFALAAAQAAVTRVDVAAHADVPIVNYEASSGKVYFAVDPKLAANRNIADIDLAPRNAKGLVEFSADFYVLKPKAGAPNNGTALVEVSNRGSKGILAQFDLAPGGDLSKREDFGDPLLFENGYTLVWIGWEWDVPEGAGMRLYAPVVQGITGNVRSEILVDRPASVASLGDRTVTPYPVADRESGTLTVQDKATGPRTAIPRNQWKFSADGGKIELASGFEPGRIYEVIYKAKDPVVAGLGAAAIRDYVTYLKQKGEAKRALAFGISQSGRYLRKYLYDGFNADEQGHKVFEGVWAHVASGGRGGFNNRFAQPSRDGHPWSNLFYPTDVFPFTDEAETDGGITDGLLARAERDKVVPKIFYTNGSYEYFARSAAIIHTTIDAKKDVTPPADSRVYFLAGTQHAANVAPVRTVTQNTPNPSDYRYAMRALLVAMNGWITNGTTPPDSKIPHIAKDDLVSYSALAFPKVPGVAMPKETGVSYRLDFGPDFRTKGILAFDPPKIGKPFPVLVPQVNSDGNEVSGIRSPELAAPLATYTGWNLRDQKVGAPDMLYSMVGSMIPFARTRAEREKSGDPRPSIEERYKNRDDYLAQVQAAAQPLVQEHLLLDRDVPKIKNKAGDRWDSFMKPSNQK